MGQSYAAVELDDADSDTSAAKFSSTGNSAGCSHRQKRTFRIDIVAWLSAAKEEENSEASAAAERNRSRTFIRIGIGA